MAAVKTLLVRVLQIFNGNFFTLAAHDTFCWPESGQSGEHSTVFHQPCVMILQ